MMQHIVHRSIHKYLDLYSIPVIGDHPSEFAHTDGLVKNSVTSGLFSLARNHSLSRPLNC